MLVLIQCCCEQVLGPPGLASTGVEQAKAAVAEMFGEDRHSDHAATITKDNFPVGVWTIPEMGYYGLTKEAAIKKGIDAEEGAQSHTHTDILLAFSAPGQGWLSGGDVLLIDLVWF